jgi:hypothetical protein
MTNIRLTKNPFLLFLPFLLIFIILVIISPPNGTTGDENRYLMFAQHLLHGFYSWPAPNIDLGYGPGYPILILPFLALKLPFVFIGLMNAVLYYFSIILLFKTLRKFISFPLSVACCLFWACFYNSYENINLILPEIFTAFLISLLLYNIFPAFNTKDKKVSNKYIYFSGITIGFIALTKIIFGYVLLATLFTCVAIWILNSKNQNYKRAVVICVIALITTVPYLFYTYHITNRILYWGTTGGENFYWMSSPIKDEYGSWIQYPMGSQSKPNLLPGSEEIIVLRHKKDFDQILKLQGVERDSVYTKIAIENIKAHPIKFLKNCFSNVGRILFNYPYSYTLQKNTTLLRIALNGIVIVCILFCLVPTLINWRNLLFPIRFLLFFILLYFCASILASAETRMFTIMVPILLFWIAFIFQKSIKVNLKEW